MGFLLTARREGYPRDAKTDPPVTATPQDISLVRGGPFYRVSVCTCLPVRRTCHF